MERVSLKMDFAFRELMEDAQVRRYFLSDVLDLPVEQMKETRLGNSFLRRRRKLQKQGILDVKVVLWDGTRINIELQLRMQKFWEKRSLYYLAKMYTDILFVGDNYNKLQRCICIHILDFNLTDRPAYHEIYRLRNTDGDDYSNLFEIHTIELQKKLQGESRIDDWIRLMNAEREEDLDMIGTGNMGIQRAKQILHEMSLTGTIREAWDDYWKQKRDRWAEDEYVYDQGKLEGEEIGQKRGEEIGQKRGEQIGQQRGEQIGKQKMLFKLVSAGKLDIGTAAEESGMTQKEFEEKLREAGYGEDR